MLNTTRQRFHFRFINLGFNASMLQSFITSCHLGLIINNAIAALQDCYYQTHFIYQGFASTPSGGLVSTFFLLTSDHDVLNAVPLLS